jgi:lysophospholipase L1-like esterase
MAPRFAAAVKLAEKPACVFINAGVNDVFRAGLDKPHDPATVAVFRTNVTHMVTEAQAAGVRVILLTPTIWSENPDADPNKRLTLYAEAMKQIAAEAHCDCMDLHSLFLHALTAKSSHMQLTSGDGIHMNAFGDILMAIGVLRALGVPDSKIAATDVTPILGIR